jgi:sortase A
MPESFGRALLPVLMLLALQQFGSAGLIHLKAWLAPALVERAWQRGLNAGGTAVKPWPWADTWPVARLEVPALGVSQLVLAGDRGNALAFGPGHHSASAMPGAQGLALIGGHRDTHFAFLEYLQRGQRIQLQLPTGEARHYRVRDMSIVDSRLDQPYGRPGREQLWLVTCYPFDAVFAGGPLRYVVRAEPEAEVLTGRPLASSNGSLSL